MRGATGRFTSRRTLHPMEPLGCEYHHELWLWLAKCSGPPALHRARTPVDRLHPGLVLVTWAMAIPHLLPAYVDLMHDDYPPFRRGQNPHQPINTRSAVQSPTRDTPDSAPMHHPHARPLSRHTEGMSGPTSCRTVDTRSWAVMLSEPDRDQYVSFQTRIPQLRASYDGGNDAVNELDLALNLGPARV